MTLLRFLNGDFAGNGCPMHPAFVHLPIVLIPLAAFIKAAAAVGFLPSHPGSWPWSAAHFICGLAVASLVPTAVTGMAEYLRLDKRDQGATRKVQLHAALNYLVGAITVYCFVKASSRPDKLPTQSEIILGLVSAGILVVSGHLGGELVYEHGVGVQRQGKAARKRRGDGSSWE
jgi:uncharacterized membrane protein